MRWLILSKIGDFHLLGRTAPYSEKCLSLVGYPMEILQEPLYGPHRKPFLCKEYTYQ